MTKRDNLTKYTDRELALVVYNYPFWYYKRFKPSLISLLREYYIFTPAQEKHLKETLMEEENETND